MIRIRVEHGPRSLVMYRTRIDGAYVWRASMFEHGALVARRTLSAESWDDAFTFGARWLRMVGYKRRVILASGRRPYRAYQSYGMPI